MLTSRKIILLGIIAMALLMVSACKKSNDRTGSKEDNYEMQLFIDKLMSKMTLEEKIGQLNLPTAGQIVTGQTANSDIGERIRNGEVGGLFNVKGVENIAEIQRIAIEESRMKIPLFFAMDVIHGFKTVFPIPLALSCSWDMDLIREIAGISSLEASSDGICLTFSPMLDISRDPRWGRVAEGNGEDPLLASRIATAMVEGYQGNNLSDTNTIMACVKHFALYGAPEGGRDYNTTDMSRIRMYNEYFPPYKAAVEAGAGSFMTSFNEVDGIPASANKWLLTDVLRNQWGFGGFVVSDYTAVTELIYHGLGSLKEVSAKALKAGLDMDMVSEGFLGTLKTSVEEGKVKVEDVNKACTRILEAKYKLGLFDDPWLYCNLARSERNVYNSEHRAKAREIATNTFVLLKNDNNLLPLDKESTIALIGPLAKNRENMGGTWSVAGDMRKYVSVYDGIRSIVGDDKLLYAKGSNIYKDEEMEARVTLYGKSAGRDERTERDMIREALRVADRSDIIVAVVGETAEMSGESSSRSDIRIPQTQRNLLEALLKTDKPVVMLLLTGRPLDLSWEDENVPAILNMWFAGSEAGYAAADVLFGDANPSGKLSMSFPRNVGQVPVYYNHKNTGRPLPEGGWFTKFTSAYLDVVNDPLYPFGYGLSYSTFSYGNTEVSDTALEGEDAVLHVSVDVKNTGVYPGKEVVQLYIHDPVASVTRPVKELKEFKKIFLEPGESTTVDFQIGTEALKFYNSDLVYDWEEGDFEIMLGPNSRDLQKTRISWIK